MQEVECGAGALLAGAELLTIIVFTPANDRVVASVNVASGRCLTSALFSSCVVAEGDARKTVVRSLVAELSEGESRVFGCNVTVVVPGGRLQTVTWLTTVTLPSKCEPCRGRGQYLFKCLLDRRHHLFRFVSFVSLHHLLSIFLFFLLHFYRQSLSIFFLFIFLIFFLLQNPFSRARKEGRQATHHVHVNNIFYKAVVFSFFWIMINIVVATTT